jgi:hypothetical protein
VATTEGKRPSVVRYTVYGLGLASLTPVVALLVTAV